MKLVTNVCCRVFEFGWRWTVAGAVLVACGCGQSSDAPVLSVTRGVVTFQNKPLPGAQVLFTPTSGPMAMGTTNEQGEFVLQTQGKDGAPVSDHRVTIQAYKAGKAPKSDASGQNADNAVVPVVSLIPEKYGNLKLSDLTATVQKDPSQNEFRFELK